MWGSIGWLVRKKFIAKGVCSLCFVGGCLSAVPNLFFVPWMKNLWCFASSWALLCGLLGSFILNSPSVVINPIRVPLPCVNFLWCPWKMVASWTGGSLLCLRPILLLFLVGEGVQKISREVTSPARCPWPYVWILVVVDGGGFSSGAIMPLLSSIPLVLRSALCGGYWMRAKKAWLVGKFVGLMFDGGNEAAIDDLEKKMNEWCKPWVSGPHTQTKLRDRFRGKLNLGTNTNNSVQFKDNSVFKPII